jgi:hypothetical protein
MDIVHRHIAVHLPSHPAYDENHPVGMTDDTFDLLCQQLLFQIKACRKGVTTGKMVYVKTDAPTRDYGSNDEQNASCL